MVRQVASKPEESDAAPEPVQEALSLIEEVPFAIVQGAALRRLPRDLFIPPNALEVFLDNFEGPLDLLLYLIRRENLDILDIPIATITRQYMVYVELMKAVRLELAAEYLVMAAVLAEIKSRMLLPRPSDISLEEDPRAELIRRLQEYERYKQVADDLNAQPQVGRDVFPMDVEIPAIGSRTAPPPAITLKQLLDALKEVLARAENFSHHHIEREPLSVRERMSRVLGAIHAGEFVHFSSLFTPEEGRRGVVVTFLALLELLRESLIELVQADAFSPIYVRVVKA